MVSPFSLARITPFKFKERNGCFSRADCLPSRLVKPSCVVTVQL